MLIDREVLAEIMRTYADKRSAPLNEDIAQKADLTSIVLLAMLDQSNRPNVEVKVL